MTGTTQNYYKSSRMAAGLTQEKAAAAIGCDVRTLARYESGHDVPDDIVDMMAVHYGNDQLPRWHVETSRLGKYMPDRYTVSLAFDIIIDRDGIRQIAPPGMTAMYAGIPGLVS